MASSFVFYKFKSQREPSRIAFDGTSITVFDLKKEIIAENKMGKGADFDFAIYHADTEEGRQRSIDSLHHRRLVRFDTLVPWGLLRQPLLPFPYPLLCAFRCVVVSKQCIFPATGNLASGFPSTFSRDFAEHSGSDLLFFSPRRARSVPPSLPQSTPKTMNSSLGRRLSLLDVSLLRDPAEETRSSTWPGRTSPVKGCSQVEAPRRNLAAASAAGSARTCTRSASTVGRTLSRLAQTRYVRVRRNCGVGSVLTQSILSFSFPFFLLLADYTVAHLALISCPRCMRSLAAANEYTVCSDSCRCSQRRSVGNGSHVCRDQHPVATNTRADGQVSSLGVEVAL